MQYWTKIQSLDIKGYQKYTKKKTQHFYILISKYVLLCAGLLHKSISKIHCNTIRLGF